MPKKRPRSESTPKHADRPARGAGDLARRVLALLADAADREAGEVADELAGLLVSSPDTWPGRVVEILGRRLTRAETAAIRRLQRAEPSDLPHVEFDGAAGPKPSGSR